MRSSMPPWQTSYTSSTPPLTRSWSGGWKQAQGKSIKVFKLSEFPLLSLPQSCHEGSRVPMMGPTTHQGWSDWTISRPMTTSMSFSRYLHTIESYNLGINVDRSCWTNILHDRLCPMSRGWGIFSWTRITTRISRDRQEISAFSWWPGQGTESCVSCERYFYLWITGLENLSGNSGMWRTSRLMSAPTRCCRQLCSAARRSFRSQSRFLA